MMAEYTPLEDLSDVTRETVLIGESSAEWISTPYTSIRRTVIFLHGGCFVMGSVQSHIDFVARLSRSLEARILCVEYRLAPEFPFPAAVRDSVNAFRMLIDSGIDADTIVLSGLSAGGGLALSTFIVLRDCGEPLPAAIVCLSPEVDLTLQSSSFETNAGKDWGTRAVYEETVAEYMSGADPAQSLASPLMADLDGLPPLLIQVGGNEVLLDDSLRLAAVSRDNGARVNLDIWPEMMHAWQLFASKLPEARRAIERLSADLLSVMDSWN